MASGQIGASIADVRPRVPMELIVGHGLVTLIIGTITALTVLGTQKRRALAGPVNVQWTGCGRTGVPGTHVPYPVEEVHKNEPEYARLKRVRLMVPTARAIRTRVSHVEQIIAQWMET